ncbi:AraC family transcriptional regulator [Phytopseudomonas dryadis]|uniref:AraC family transcriptional regulator n=1 Tax=Phytopseudomonas dryadis TaxID=2487520 RepID=A0A4Q9R5C3_9GAMM|nr:AraC family transcriptional regulator [Pseudomonas dryadis]TBU93983.1 AraC family transcriptional regulator [Pseudomonas dryadis]
MQPGDREQARFSSCADVGGVELLTARFVEHRYAPHVHQSYAIAVVEAGAERYRYRGEEHVVSAGHLALLNPDEVHTGRKATDDGWRYRVFYPEPQQFQALLEELELPSAVPALRGSVHRDELLVPALLDLHRQLQDPLVSVLQRQTRWREVMLQLLQRHAQAPVTVAAGNEPLAVSQARELLASRLAEPPSLEALAAAVNLSPFHFARVFRRSTGLPPHAWLQQRRLEQARTLLRDGCAPLSVALQLGFSDQSHLGRQFKQAYGVAPGEYRSACQRSSVACG